MDFDHGEQQYNVIKGELLKNVRDLEKTYRDKLKYLNKNKASKADRERILRSMEMQLRTARQKVVEFEQKATKPGAAAKRELNLFAVGGGNFAFNNL